MTADGGLVEYFLWSTKRAQTWLIIYDCCSSCDTRQLQRLVGHVKGKKQIALTGPAIIESNQRNGIDETMRYDIYPEVPLTDEIDDSE